MLSLACLLVVIVFFCGCALLQATGKKIIQLKQTSNKKSNLCQNLRAQNISATVVLSFFRSFLLLAHFVRLSDSGFIHCRELCNCSFLTIF